jgi:DNA-binding beta-propeller fold protein YncE
MIVTNEADNTITLHDIRSGKLLKTVPTSKYGDRPRGIKVSPDGSAMCRRLSSAISCSSSTPSSIR